jgi:hypothetical protein
MRKLLLLATTAGLGLAASFLSSGQAYAAACGSGALTGYLGEGFTCTIGDKTFSNFSYVPDGNGQGIEITPSAAAIQVIPSPAPQYGFTFDGIWSATTTALGQNSIADSALSYRVSVTNGTPLITSGHVTIAGSSTGAGSNGSLTETLSPGGNLVANTQSPPGSLTNNITFGRAEHGPRGQGHRGAQRPPGRLLCRGVVCNRHRRPNPPRAGAGLAGAARRRTVRPRPTAPSPLGGSLIILTGRRVTPAATVGCASLVGTGERPWTRIRSLQVRRLLPSSRS